MAGATVLYVLEAGGNLAKALPSLAGGLDQVRAKAQAAASAVGQGLSTGAEQGRKALEAVGKEAHEAMEGVAKAGAAFALLAFGVNKVLSADREWRESTARTTAALERMQKQVAATFGKEAGHYLDMFTLGFVYLANLATQVLPPAFDAASRALNAFVHDEGLDVLLYLATGQWQKALNAAFTPKTDNDALVKALQEDYQKVLDGQTHALEEAKKAWFKLVDGIQDEKGKKSPYEGKGVFGSGATGTFLGTSGLGGYNPGFGQMGGGFGAMGPLLLPLEKSLIPLADIAAELPGLSAMFETYTKQLQLQGAADSVSGFDQAASGGLAGVATAFGGPIGALVGAILGLVDHLPDLLTSLVDEAVTLFVDLPTTILGLLGTTLPQILTDQIPKIVASFPLLSAQLIFAVLRSIPAILGALMQLLPRAVAEMVRQLRIMITDIFSGSLWTSFGRRFLDGFKGIFDAANQIGGDLGIHLGAKAAGHRTFFGIHIPKLDDGGTILRSGLVYAHEGEQYLGAPGSRTQQRTSSGGPVFHINTLALADLRSFADQLRRAQGSWGIGLRTDPLAGR